MPTRRVTDRPSQSGGRVEGGPDRNAVRRAAYDQVPGVADAARQNSRARYQAGAPAPRRLQGGLLTAGTEREVTYEEAEHPVVVQSFTIPELAAALGRAVLTLRRWIEADKIPAPYLQDTSRSLRVYSIGEAEVIATVLSRHEAAYRYLTSTNQAALQEMHESMHFYRAHNV